jgi:hypothetical protein
MTVETLNDAPPKPPQPPRDAVAMSSPEDRVPYAIFMGSGRECRCVAAGPNVEVGRRLLRTQFKGGVLLIGEAAHGYSVTAGPSPARELQTAVATAMRAPPAPVVQTKAELRETSRLQGYTGDACDSCGNFTLVRNGTCLKCNSCGSTSGCS